jgi:hypothetical protein
MRKNQNKSERSTRSKLKLIAWLIAAPFIILALLFILLIMHLSGPRIRDNIQTLNSSDSRYTLFVDYVDYGGSPGIRLEVILKRNGLFGFKKQIKMTDSLRQKMPCYPTYDSNLDCPEELEPFEVKDNYLLWYGEKIPLN